MKNLLSALSLLLILSLSAIAQNTFQDVLYFKSGSIMRGKILNTTAEQIKIELSNGNIYNVPRTEIANLKKESAPTHPLLEKHRWHFHNKSGYSNITEFSFLAGLSPKVKYYTPGPDNGVSIQTINGYRFNQYLFTGVGLGINRLTGLKQTFSPFFVRAASQFLNARVAPYTFIDAGYSLPWSVVKHGVHEPTNHGGIYFSTGIGMRVYTQSKASFIISVAYRLIGNKVSGTNYDGQISIYQKTELHHYLALSAGFSF